MSTFVQRTFAFAANGREQMWHLRANRQYPKRIEIQQSGTGVIVTDKDSEMFYESL